MTGYVKPGPCFIQGCDANQPIGSLPIDGLAVGSSVSGSFTFTAPAASKDSIVTLQFFDRSASEIYPPPSGEITDSLATAARYRVILNSMHITTTRAHFRDTDYAELTVGVNGNALPMQFVSLGSLSSGDQPGRTTDYPLSLVSDTFDLVPRDDVGIRFNYAVLNAGFNGNHEQFVHDMTDQLSHIAASVATAYTAGWTAPLWALADSLMQQLHNLMYVDCDGVVASDDIAASGSVLSDWTFFSNSYSETRHYGGPGRAGAGYVSPDGCGATSDYTVTWSLQRIRQD